jgi:hypothetical protein
MRFASGSTLDAPPCDNRFTLPFLILRTAHAVLFVVSLSRNHPEIFAPRSSRYFPFGRPVMSTHWKFVAAP